MPGSLSESKRTPANFEPQTPGLQGIYVHIYIFICKMIMTGAHHSRECKKKIPWGELTEAVKHQQTWKKFQKLPGGAHLNFSFFCDAYLPNGSTQSIHKNSGRRDLQGESHAFLDVTQQIAPPSGVALP